MRTTPEERLKDKITIKIMANNNKENANASNTGAAKSHFIEIRESLRMQLAINLDLSEK